jgi:DNA (cytosine-5)-methyltransferase 1
MIGSLFSGIGGLERGLEMAGLGPVVWQVEQSEFCRRVLARHWPRVTRYSDVRTVGAHNLAPVDLICGGFPCQDISSAGKGAGLAGERSGLWREYARILEERRPRWAVVENVASGARRWVDAVVSELAQLGYETLPLPVSAQDVGAPHRRQRIFLVAYAERHPLRFKPRWGRGAGGQGALQSGHDGEAGAPADAQRTGLEVGEGERGWSGGPPVSPVCGVDDGFPNRMDELAALGNAVVPQCAEVVGWVIRELMGCPP